jgi:hypothetical protein
MANQSINPLNGKRVAGRMDTGIRISIPQTMVVLRNDRHFNRPPEKSAAGVNTP